MTYNDRSPLENMHAATLFGVLADDRADIFAALSDAEWTEARKLVIASILATDVVHHFPMVKKMEVFFEHNGAFPYNSDSKIFIESGENRMFLGEVILHASDVSNPTKPFDICAAWTVRVYHEFFMLGDKEKSRGLKVGPMNDPELLNKPKGQVNFVQFVVGPLYKGESPPHGRVVNCGVLLVCERTVLPNFAALAYRLPPCPLCTCDSLLENLSIGRGFVRPDEGEPNEVGCDGQGRHVG